MEVQPVNVHNMISLLESFLHVSIFEHAMPVAVRAHARVNETPLLERIFRGHHGRQRLIFHFNEFRRILSRHPILRHDRGHRLALVHDLVHGHRVIRNFLRAARTNLDERLNLPLDFGAR